MTAEAGVKAPPRQIHRGEAVWHTRRGVVWKGEIAMMAEPMTVALPEDLVAAVDRLVEEGRARAAVASFATPPF